MTAVTHLTRIACRSESPERGHPHQPQAKFDGFRSVLYISGRECYIRSKRGKVLSRFAELALRVGRAARTRCHSRRRGSGAG